MAIHLLHNPLRFKALVEAFREGDAIIMFDEALERWAELKLSAVTLLSDSVYALHDEFPQKQSDIDTGDIIKIGYTDWVALTIQHPHQVNWT
jgi:sulfur transfer complex TusBCD TusB component (DsrH family)